MLQQFKHRIVVLLLSSILAITSLSGCQEKKESMKLGEWLEIIQQELNIPDSFEKKPYFMNVQENHPSFSAIQAGVEWEILDTGVYFDPDLELTREWIAYTLINLYGEIESNQKIKDSSKSQFPEHIAKIVSLGVLKLDKRDCFNPKKKVSNPEAQEILSTILPHLNDFSVIEDKVEINYSPDINFESKEPLFFDSNSKVAIFNTEDIHFEVGDLLYMDSEGEEIYKVQAIITEGEETEVYLELPNFDEIIENMDVETTFDVDFSDVDFEEEEVGNNDLSFSNPFFEPLARKEFSFQGFSVHFDATSAGLQVKVSKSLSKGGNLNAEFKLFDLQPTVKWKTRGLTIEEAYFKLKYSTSSQFSFQKGRYKHHYSDFSFLQKGLIKSFENDLTRVSATIPLGTVNIPVPSVPGMTIKAKLQIYLYANGKIELSFKNDMINGIEIRNNKMRVFSNPHRESEILLRATAGIVGSLSLGLDMLNMSLLDIATQIGIRGKVESTLHHNDGSIITSSLDIETLDQQKEKESIKSICSALEAYWVFDIAINSDKTLGSKLGLSWQKSFWNNKNASLFPKMKKYMENGKFVNHCSTPKDFRKKEDVSLIASDKITLHKNNMLINIGDKKILNFKTLPDGYEVRDLEFTSNNENIARVDFRGNIQGISRGATIIQIKTKDNIYHINVHILVVEKKES